MYRKHIESKDPWRQTSRETSRQPDKHTDRMGQTNMLRRTERERKPLREAHRGRHMHTETDIGTERQKYGKTHTNR